jgi:hypothetical protein
MMDGSHTNNYPFSLLFVYGGWRSSAQEESGILGTYPPPPPQGKQRMNGQIFAAGARFTSNLPIRNDGHVPQLLQYYEVSWLWS